MDMLLRLKELADQKNLSPVQLWVGDQVILESSLDTFTMHLLGKNYQSHPNFFDLKPMSDKKEITLEPTHELLYFLKTTPTLPTWRVVTIKTAELLSRQSTNALLKILETPPRDTLIVLLTEAPGKLLPTLLSRCTRMTFDVCHELVQEPEITQQLGKLILTMMARGPGSVQGTIDALEDDLCPKLVDALRPFLYKLIAYIKGDQASSPGLEQLLKLAPHEQWVEAYQVCSDYLDQAIPAHLPLREILRGGLYLIHDPRLSYSSSFIS